MCRASHETRGPPGREPEARVTNAPTGMGIGQPLRRSEDPMATLSAATGRAIGCGETCAYELLGNGHGG